MIPNGRMSVLKMHNSFRIPNQMQESKVVLMTSIMLEISSP